MLQDLDRRSRQILRQVIDSYIETGEPVGSKTLAQRLGASLSPASIRSVMADLEAQGLLKAPHISAGRIPTDAGFRLFVDGILEINGISEEERQQIDSTCAAHGRTLPEVLETATAALSGLSHCAGLVVAPKIDAGLKQIEFVALGPGQALVVLVGQDGMIENRLMEVPLGVPASALQQASNYLNARLSGRTLAEISTALEAELAACRAELDTLAAGIAEKGLGTWVEAAGGGAGDGYLIVKGQARLLEDVTALADLERIRGLMQALETRETMLGLMQAAGGGEGVQIFIGAENSLFNMAGCAMIVAPYMNSREKIVGTIGVIGPTRVNYARIIPMVDYTARVIGNLLGKQEQK